MMRVTRTALALVLSFCLSCSALAESITISAAISLKESIVQVGKAFEKRTGQAVQFNFGASGPLAAQIESGAPVDGFISAANLQVDQLVRKGKADASTRRLVVQNEIVLIVPAASRTQMGGFADLGHPPGKIAIGQPKSVPAGQYAMQTLEKLGLSSALADKIVYGANVRQVLDYVVRNEVDAGIVYSTDAKQVGDTVRVIASADPSTHEPIEYPGIVISGAAHPAEAKKFLDFLADDEARAIFTAAGFILPSPPATTQPTP